MLRVDGGAMLLLLLSPSAAKHCVGPLLRRGQLKVCKGGRGCSVRKKKFLYLILKYNVTMIHSISTIMLYY